MVLNIVWFRYFITRSKVRCDNCKLTIANQITNKQINVNHDKILIFFGTLNVCASICIFYAIKSWIMTIIQFLKTKCSRYKIEESRLLVESSEKRLITNLVVIKHSWFTHMMYVCIWCTKIVKVWNVNSVNSCFWNTWFTGGMAYQKILKY